jgi:hypothetical protein
VKLTRRKWVVVGVALVILAALSVPLSAWIVNRSSGPSEETVLDKGFAIWPVDTLNEARSECPSPLVQSWRHSGKETVRRFAQEMLGVTAPKVAGPGESDGRIVYEIYGRHVPLFHYAGVRRSGSCWYVTDVMNREGFCCNGQVGVAGVGANRALFLHIRAFGGDMPELIGELGYGGRTARATELDLERSESTIQVSIPTGAERSSGHHILAITDTPGFPAGLVEGFAFGAPVDPSDVVTLPTPEDARDEILAVVREKKECDDRGWYEGYPAYRTVRFFRQDAEANGTGDSDYQTDYLRGPRRGDSEVAIDQARVRFDSWRVRKGCWMLGRIAPLRGTERVRSLGVFDSAASLDLEWGRATDVWIGVGFGGATTTLTASPIANPIVTDDGQHLNTRRPGSYVVFFYRGKNLINIDGGALPPIESFAD